MVLLTINRAAYPFDKVFWRYALSVCLCFLQLVSCKNPFLNSYLCVSRCTLLRADARFCGFRIYCVNRRDTCASYYSFWLNKFRALNCWLSNVEDNLFSL